MNKLVWFVVLAISALAYGDRVKVIDNKDVFKHLDVLNKAVQKEGKIRLDGQTKIDGIIKRYQTWDKNIPGRDSWKEAFLELDPAALTRLYDTQTKRLIDELKGYVKERDERKKSLKKDRNLDWEPFDVHTDWALENEISFLEDWQKEVQHYLSGTENRITHEKLSDEEKAKNKLIAMENQIMLLQKMNQDRILLSYGKVMLRENVDRKDLTPAEKRILAIGAVQKEERATGNLRKNWSWKAGNTSIYDASPQTSLPMDALAAFLEAEDGDKDVPTIRMGQYIMFDRHVPELLSHQAVWTKTKLERVELEIKRLKGEK